jgi:hypothetical protein
MPDTPSLPSVAKAQFQIQGPGGPEGDPITVLFNPASLDYTVSNQMKDQPGGGKKQFVEKTSASLKMQLTFDTTDSGDDVRGHTGPVLRLLQPREEGGSPVPPTVKFEWGAFAFTGLVSEYKEVMDFFAPSGVPLRSTVDLSLTDQDFQFQQSDLGTRDTSGGQGVEPTLLPDAEGGASELANRLGTPNAARAIAAVSGASSLRAGVGGAMAIGGFSPGAGGMGTSGALGLRAGLADSGGASKAALGSVAAFGQLRQKPPPPPKLPSASAALAVGVGAAGSSPGGAGSAGFKADVGADADLNALISFG